MRDYFNDWSMYEDEDIKKPEQKQEDSSKKQPEESKRQAKKGYEASAFRGDLSTDKMADLRKKGYSYRKIADVFGCSPSTVRNRLRDKELLKALWIE